MPTGLKIPVGVDKKGRAAIQKDESDNTRKVLILAFAEGGDNNPFQRLGIDKQLIFGVKKASFRGKALQAVTEIMNKFTEIARLDVDTVEFDATETGEFVISFKYVDLLKDQVKTFRTTRRK